MKTRHFTRSVEQLADLFCEERLNLSPAFQRDSVWGPGDRNLLIQSLLDDIPLPAIYMYRRASSGGDDEFDVIDGKQRLESILLFMEYMEDSDGAVHKVTRPVDADSGRTRSLSWEQLSEREQRKILRAQLPIIEVDGELAEIIELFVRINSTGKSLSRQERLHARWSHSRVLDVAHSVAEDHEFYFQRNRVLSKGQMKRMKHVEFVTELLLAMHFGGPLNKKEKIDQVIAGDAHDGTSLAPAKQRLVRALELTEAILPNIEETRFRGLADFYSLVLTIDGLRETGHVIAVNSTANDLAGGLLIEFGNAVDDCRDRMRTGRPITHDLNDARRYLATVKEGTDTFRHRSERQRILRQVIGEIYAFKDPVRHFNETQRRLLWHASPDKLCAADGCNKKVAWADLSIDHRLAHARGGPTELTNATLMHRRCNSGKGVR